MEIVIEEVRVIPRQLSGDELKEILLEALSEEGSIVLCETIENLLESEGDFL